MLLSYLIVGLVFALLGFLLHTCLLRGSGKTALTAEIRNLKKTLEAKDAEARELAAKAEKAGTIIRSLEERIRQRDEESRPLRDGAARQDDEIRQFQSDDVMLHAAPATAVDIRPAGGPDLGVDRVESVAAVSSDRMEKWNRRLSGQEREAQAVETDREPVEPAWKKDLSRILAVLDSAGNEVSRRPS